MKSSILLILILLINQAFAFDIRRQAMGDTCYFIRQKKSMSLCQPANIVRDDKQFFFGHFLFSEDMSQSENWRKVVEGKATSREVISLIEDDRENYLSNETEFGFVGQSWAIRFKPYELWVESRIQNPAYPYAQIDSGIAQVIALDFGHYLSHEIAIGLTVESARLETLKKSFFIPDLLVDEDSVEFKPDKKNQIVASPGISFEPIDAWGAARYSALLKQSYVSSTGILYTGVSFENEFVVGRLEWGLGTKFQKSVATKPQVFTHYQIGITTLTTSLSADEQSYGAFLELKGFESGLSYIMTNDQRVLFFQLGLSL